MASPNPAETKKHLALAIIDYLNSSLTDGTIAQDDRESIEVATSCISDAFKVDPTNDKSFGSQESLLSIYATFEKSFGQAAHNATETNPSVSSTSASGAKNLDAEALKGQGNVAMQAKDYAKAIEMYSKAIEIAPTNPIYLSNRAAAYSATSQHELARNDAEMAVASDPKYTKAWSRLGLARYALGDAKGSMEAYKSGIDAEGKGGSDAMKRGYETAKRRVEEMGSGGSGVGSPRASSLDTESAGGMPDLSSLASMLGGGGAGGQGGGMPDLGSLMNNPMMRQMAQNIMSNPAAMQSMMSNPRIQQMMNQFGGGGGGGGAESGEGPNLASLMQDPSIAELARNFMGGAGGGAGGAPGGGAPPR